MKSLNVVAVVAAWGALAAGGAVHAQEAVQWRVEDGGNGHWYLFRPLGYADSWTSAQQDAEASGGHLATLTSQDELEFVKGLGPCTACSCCGPHWYLGGVQPSGAAEPLEGWRWVTEEPWDFAPWAAGEPNDAGNEDYLYLSFSGDCASAGLMDGRESGNNYCIAGVVEWSADCNGDGIVDYGQIRDGTLFDGDGN